MSKKLLGFLTVPPDLRTEFWRESVQKNRLSLLVICIMIFGMELFNIARVLFWSRSGLGTLNNRIYFYLYCILLLSAALSLLLQRQLRGASVRAQWMLQYGTTVVFFLWHICLNTYDLMGDPASGITSMITAVLGLAIFIQMSSLYSTLCFVVGYVLFLFLGGPFLDTGTIVNLTITCIVALAVSFTGCHHAVIQISQRREINQINAQLHALLQEEPLTGLLNRAAFQQRVERLLQAPEPPLPLALLIIDMDDFKSINDRCGHPCGDHVLVETGSRLRAAFPKAAGISRIGGDEFAIFLTGPAAQGALEETAQQLIRSISEIRWQGRRMDASCSIGACRVRRPALSYEQLYMAADRALYDAKQQGKCRCCLRELPDGLPKEAH